VCTAPLLKLGAKLILVFLFFRRSNALTVSSIQYTNQNRVHLKQCSITIIRVRRYVPNPYYFTWTRIRVREADWISKVR
jgi:hypothetical protein